MGNGKVPESLKTLFWDVDWGNIDISRHRDFIIERILNMGDEVSIGWLWKVFSEAEICFVVRNSRRLSKKTARCWQNYFRLTEEEMACFGTYLTSPDNYY
jgi:hypothetical protein